MPLVYIRSRIFRGRENSLVGTWNMITLRAAGKLEELAHVMGRYHWNIL